MPRNRRSRPAGGGSSNIVDATSTTENGSTHNSVNKVLEQLIGSQICGGCESCDAFQTVAARRPGAYVLTVHHDAWCPEQQDREGRL
jgi:hypothetical protein